MEPFLLNAFNLSYTLTIIMITLPVKRHILCLLLGVKKRQVKGGHEFSVTLFLNWLDLFYMYGALVDQDEERLNVQRKSGWFRAFY